MKTKLNSITSIPSMESKKTERKKAIHFFSFLVLSLIFTLSSSSLMAQNTEVIKTASKGITVKGIVKDGTEPLISVSILLKGSTVGTETDTKGQFTFPKKLKPGDVLIFSYVGYTPREIKN